MRTHKEIFTDIYNKNVWGGSGGGSSPENTVEYRKLLQKFLKDKNIKSVIDFGCGDWSFSHMIDWSGIEYNGLDAVSSVIDSNRIKHTKSNVHFYVWADHTSIGGDLLILKDVLQHWSNDQIIDFLSGVINAEKSKYTEIGFKYILITNTLGTSENDITPGDCRGLSANLYPLKQFNPEILAVIKTTITSEVSLITNI